MFCKKCGYENNDNAAFCNNCGAQLNEPQVNNVPPQAPQQPQQQQGAYYQPSHGGLPFLPTQQPVPQPKKKSKAGLVIGIIVAVIVLIIGVVVGAAIIFNNTGATGSNGSILGFEDIDDIDDLLEYGEDDDEHFGTLDDYSYVNSELFITLTETDDFRILSKDEMKESYGSNVQYDSENDTIYYEDSGLRLYFECVLVDDTNGNNVQLIISQEDLGISKSEFVESFMTGISQGAEYKKTGSADYQGADYDLWECESSTDQGIPIKFICAVAEIEDCYVCYIITTADMTETFDSIMEPWSVY